MIFYNLRKKLFLKWVLDALEYQMCILGKVDLFTLREYFGGIGWWIFSVIKTIRVLWDMYIWYIDNTNLDLSEFGDWLIQQIKRELEEMQ